MIDLYWIIDTLIEERDRIDRQIQSLDPAITGEGKKKRKSKAVKKSPGKKSGQAGPDLTAGA